MKDIMFKRLEKDMKCVFSVSVKLELDLKNLSNLSPLHTGMKKNRCNQDFKNGLFTTRHQLNIKVSIFIFV